MWGRPSEARARPPSQARAAPLGQRPAREPICGARRRLPAPPRRPRPPGTCIPLGQSARACRLPRDLGRAEDLLLPQRQRDAGGRARAAAAGLGGALTLLRPACAQRAPLPPDSLSPCSAAPGAPPYGRGPPRVRRCRPADQPAAPGAGPGRWMFLKLPRSCAGLAAASPSAAPAAARAAAVRGMPSSPPAGPRDRAPLGSRRPLRSRAN